MRQTILITVASILIVCTGFVLFYLFKIMPVQQQISYAEENIRMYRALAEKKQNTELPETNADRETVPDRPDVERFFADFQAQASKQKVAVQSVSRAEDAPEDQTDAASGADLDADTAAQSNAATNTDTAANTGTEAGADSADGGSKPDTPNALQSVRFSIDLSAPNRQNMIDFVGDLEAMNRALSIDELSVQSEERGSTQATLSITLYYTNPQKIK